MVKWSQLRHTVVLVPCCVRATALVRSPGWLAPACSSVLPGIRGPELSSTHTLSLSLPCCPCTEFNGSKTVAGQDLGVIPLLPALLCYAPH